MTISLLNLLVGTAANDGTGDPLRTGMQKVNTNFSTIKSAIDTLQVDVPAAEIAAKAYADSLVASLWDDRGTFNASTNLFPTTGGSAPGTGAILKGDIWTIGTIATSGALLGYPVGSTVRSLTDTPGQTAANWAIGNTGLGYVPENLSSKDTSGGYVGKTLEKLNIWNTTRTFLNFLTAATTATRTWTFPDKDGTVAMTNDLPSYNCKAFVNFDGTLSGTITPRASGNIASVVKNSAGVYTITMTNALTDTNYVVAGSVAGVTVYVLWRCGDELAARTTTMFKVVIFNTAGAAGDISQCNFAVFR